MGSYVYKKLEKNNWMVASSSSGLVTGFSSLWFSSYNNTSPFSKNCWSSFVWYLTHDVYRTEHNLGKNISTVSLTEFCFSAINDVILYYFIHVDISWWQRTAKNRSENVKFQGESAATLFSEKWGGVLVFENVIN